MVALPTALRPSNGRPYGLLLHQNTIDLCLGLRSDLDSELRCFYWFVCLHQHFFFFQHSFFYFSFFSPFFFFSPIPLFGDRFLWIEQDKCVSGVFVFHVIAFAFFGTFSDFRNSKTTLQLDHFVRINP